MQKVRLISKTIQGLTTRTSNALERDSRTAQIGGLWGDFFQSELAKSSPLYGVYYHYESDYRGFFSVMAGIEINEANHNPQMQAVSINAGNYLVFKGVGEMPQAVIEAWKNIWDYFSSSDCVHSRAYQTDFELYVSATEVEIYIGVV